VVGVIAQMWRRILITALGAIALVAAVPALAQATSISEFALTQHTGSLPVDVTGGPDGNLWFTDAGTTHAIGKITPAGTITEYTQGLAGGPPQDITLGPDGNLWFTETGPTNAAIGKITPSGAITEYSLGNGHSGDAILVGPDKNIWFLDIGSNEIGRVIPSSGTITEFGMASGMHAGAQLNAMEVGPDGNIWFTDQGSTKAIGRLLISAPDTSPTKIHEFTDPSLQFPTELTAGPDGNVWFTDSLAPAIGRITPGGVLTLFGTTNGLRANAIPDGLTVGGDGNIWFIDTQSVGTRMVGKLTVSAPDGSATKITEIGLTLNGAEDDITLGADGNVWVEQANDNVPPDAGSIARITPTGTVTEFTQGLLPNANQDNDNIISGPDGNMWFNDRGAKAIGKVSLELPATATTGAASAITSNPATVAGTV
jgi:streptogramin lyase